VPLSPYNIDAERQAEPGRCCAKSCWRSDNAKHREQRRHRANAKDYNPFDSVYYRSP